MQTRYVRRSQLIFIASFLALIALGTLALRLPGVRHSGALDWNDAVFTATSAVTLAGFTLPGATVADFSLGGQLILLLLVELGGVGIMALSALFLLALGRGLSFSSTLLISGINGNLSLRHLGGFLRTVLIYTLICKASGAVLIYLGLLLSGQPGLISLWNALFLAVSCFCNAGFSPLAGGVAGTSVPVKLVCSALSICGGLGIYVICDLAEAVRERRRHLQLHTRTVLLTSLLLLAAGTFCFHAITLKNGTNLSWMDAWFFSANSRTCGLVSFDLGQLPGVGVFAASLLMLVGGAPGSTAGGFKVTSLGVVVAAVWNTCAGNRRVLMSNQTVPQEVVFQAFTVIVIFIAIFCGSVAVLDVLTPEVHTFPVIFEAASALSTTGFVLPGTGALFTGWARGFVMLLMFIGRIGPLTIMLFLLGREKPGRLVYPEGRIIIS